MVSNENFIISDAKQARELLSYIPSILIRFPDILKQDRKEVVLLFLDVAGFTTLSEKASELGPEGAEIVERSIATYFDALISVVEEYGGHPIKIAGDSLTVIFPIVESDTIHAQIKAMYCAEELRNAAVTEAVVEVGGSTFCLAHKIGIGSGVFFCSIVGDTRIKTEFVFAGSALEQAVNAEHYSKPGEVWASHWVLNNMDKEYLSYWKMNDQGYACLLDAPETQERFRDKLIANKKNIVTKRHKEISLEEIDSALTKYSSLIPGTVHTHAEKNSLQYICRHQNITILFISCPTMYVSKQEILQEVDAHYRLLQSVITQYGGFLCEFETGDKGSKFIALFGAPIPLEDSCTQAALCSEAMQKAVRDANIVTDQRIGMATGRLYVGKIGSSKLAKYSALGDRMNLAARLMLTATPWTILAEKYTVERSKTYVRWREPRVIRVKGKKEDIVVSSLEQTRARHGKDRRGRGIIGKTSEKHTCRKTIEYLKNKRGSCIAFSGPPGSGKTRMMGYVRRLSQENQLNIIDWSGSATIIIQPFELIRMVLYNWLEITDKEPKAVIEKLFFNWSKTVPDSLQSTVPHLASVLNINMEMDAESSALTPERLFSLRIRKFLEFLLYGFGVNQKTVLILDTAERLDDASLKILKDILPYIEELSILICLSYRNETDITERFSFLEQRPHIYTMPLKELSIKEAEKLMAIQLKSEYVDSELKTWIFEKTQGSPWLVEAWLSLLVDQGNISLINRVAYLNSITGSPSLPDKLESLYLIQLERLPIEARLTIQVASILGQMACPEQIVDLHPEHLPIDIITTHFKLAAQLDILWYDRGNYPWMYFSRKELQAIIHDSIPFHIRRTLHSKRIEIILSSIKDEPTQKTIFELAYHYSQLPPSDLQKIYFTKALEISKLYADYRGTVEWSTKLIEYTDKVQNTQIFYETISTLVEALLILGEHDKIKFLIKKWVNFSQTELNNAQLVEALKFSAYSKQKKGEQSSAKEDIETALSVARTLNNNEILIRTLNYATTVFGEAGDVQQSLDMAKEALDIYLTDSISKEKKKTALRENVYFSRGYALYQIGRPIDAYKDYQIALKMYESIGDLWSQSILLNNMALTLYGNKEIEKAHKSLIRCLEMKEKVGDRRELGVTHVNLGFSYYILGDFQKAKQHTEEALKLFTRQSFPVGEVYALGNLGEILWASNNFLEAEKTFSLAQNAIKEHKNEIANIELWIRLGELSLSLEQWINAESYFKMAVNKAEEKKIALYICTASEGLCEAYMNINEINHALSSIEKAILHIEQAQESLSFPQRIWLRATKILLRKELIQSAYTHYQKAVESLKLQLSGIESKNTRKRFLNAFLFNKEIINHKKIFEDIDPTLYKSTDLNMFEEKHADKKGKK